MLANPDARIAEHNLERYVKTGQLDRAYLEHLSADAAPTLAAGAGIGRRPPPDGVLSWNLGRARSRGGR